MMQYKNVREANEGYDNLQGETFSYDFLSEIGHDILEGDLEGDYLSLSYLFSGDPDQVEIISFEGQVSIVLSQGKGTGTRNHIWEYVITNLSTGRARSSSSSKATGSGAKPTTTTPTRCSSSSGCCPLLGWRRHRQPSMTPFQN